MSNRIAYRPEIEGLRAIAVVPVILLHAGFTTFSGGYVGVDVFFVISGYLITSIIQREIEAGGFSFTGFYERRARRILPALFFMILCCLPFAWAWLSPPDFETFSASVVSVCLFVSNIFFWRQTGYFDTASEFKPLLHTWSLAVEEQLYLLWPIGLILLHRYGRRWRVIALCTVAAASLAAGEYLSWHHASFAFFWAPTRVWEFTAGALCAGLRLSPSRLWGGFSSSAGILALACALMLFDDKTRVTGVAGLLPVLGTGAILLGASKDTWVHGVLASRAFVGVGRISYGAYLFHQPVLALARYRLGADLTPLQACGSIGLTLLLALVTWRWIEQPWRRRDLSWARSSRRFSIGALTAAWALMAFGLAYSPAGGLAHTAADLGERVRINFGLDRDCDGELTFSPKCQTGDDPVVLLWGDSVAMHLADAITASNGAPALIQMTRTGCAPLSGLASAGENRGVDCIRQNERILDWLRSHPAVEYVVLSSSIDYLLDPNRRVVSDEGQPIPGTEPMVLAALERTLTAVHELGRHVVVVSPMPQNGSDIGGCLVRALANGDDPAGCNFETSSYSLGTILSYQLLRKLETRWPVIWLNRLICKESKCPAYEDGVIIYRDAAHLSHEGSAYLGRQAGFWNLIRDRAE
ncbi:acyltransferase [Hypericibacter adhaerens]|uniref:Acyltransferase n=1 Tax=Hypericibacter adhaerens TaxID=2602016 RepID=A0A5J6N5K3_9PROT|nr:acyltransferase family protein [Hypericibacter adhaerens]QEX23840.1 acyltransferase [Hypericibacter adhaerens]